MRHSKSSKALLPYGPAGGPSAHLALSSSIAVLQAPVCPDSHQTLKTQGAKLVLKKEGILEVKAVTCHQGPLFALQTVYQASKGHCILLCSEELSRPSVKMSPVLNQLASP